MDDARKVLLHIRNHGARDGAVTCDEEAPGFDPSFIQMVFNRVSKVIGWNQTRKKLHDQALRYIVEKIIVEPSEQFRVSLEEKKIGWFVKFSSFYLS